MTAPPRSYRLAQVFTAYVFTLAGALTIAVIGLRATTRAVVAGAHAVERSIEATS